MTIAACLAAVAACAVAFALLRLAFPPSIPGLDPPEWDSGGIINEWYYYDRMYAGILGQLEAGCRPTESHLAYFIGQNRARFPELVGASAEEVIERVHRDPEAFRRPWPYSVPPPAPPPPCAPAGVGARR